MQQYSCLSFSTNTIRYSVLFIYEPGHEKMCLISYANNKVADQPAHPRSLISAFVVSCLDSIISLDSMAEMSRLYIASVATQAGLCLAWSESPEDTFYRVVVQLYISWFHFESQTTGKKAPDTRLFKTETRIHNQKVLWTTLSACCKLYRFSHIIYMWHFWNRLNGDFPARVRLTPILSKFKWKNVVGGKGVIQVWTRCLQNAHTRSYPRVSGI